MSSILNSNEHILGKILEYCGQKTVAEACSVSIFWWSVAIPMLYKSPILYNQRQTLNFILTLNETFIYSHVWNNETKCFSDNPEYTPYIPPSDGKDDKMPLAQLSTFPEKKIPHKTTFDNERFCISNFDDSDQMEKYKIPEKYGYTAVYWPNMVIYYKKTESSNQNIYYVKRTENTDFFKTFVFPDHSDHQEFLKKRLEMPPNSNLTRKLLATLPFFEKSKNFKILSLCSLVENFDISLASYRWYWMSSSTASVLLQHLSNLKSLDFSSCAYVQKPELYKWFLLYANSIESLSFENLNIADEFFDIFSFQVWPHLKHLNISKTFITDYGIQKILPENLPNLETIYLEDLEIGDESVNMFITSFPNLKYVSIDGTMALNSIDAVSDFNNRDDWVNITDSETDEI
ncbi:hypothetical protein BB561_001218 [Smittium simulii]|uniref:Uncharacterized protein n=1 Tax=Smittium simulii TaxID=133385 RepID=A0A2T9YVM7_9FUNG|nr:hypothetical protein BB561_001218 [Smittium simulii]